MYNVLFVDDDRNILKINEAYFSPRGYKVFTSDNCRDAVEIAKHNELDCIVLDIIMPHGEDGYVLCKTLKELGNTPIIFVTSLSEPDFLYHGFAVGGDDYLTKPYDLKELLMRIEARIRAYKGKTSESEIISFPPMLINLTSRGVTIDSKPVTLTGGEFDILVFLCENPNKVFSAEDIYTNVWKMPCLDSTHTVQVHLSHLRRKIENAYTEHKFIQTAWGKGYLFVPISSEN